MNIYHTTDVIFLPKSINEDEARSMYVEEEEE